MGKRCTWVIIIWGLSFYSVSGVNVDSLLQRFSRFNFYCIPTLSYQQQTGNVFGLNGGYYFHFLDSTRISSLSFNQIFTQKQQYTVSVSPRLYLGGEGKWTLFGNISVQKYPNIFVGIGNDRSQLLKEPITYTARNYSVYLQFQRFVNKHLSFGLQMAVQSENPVVADSLRFKAMGIHLTGWKPYFLMGAGGVISYDSRDNLFYPTRGVLGTVGMLHYNPIWGSSYNIVQISADLRQYLAVYKNHIFAWQFVTDWRLGNAIPFQMLTSLGGSSMLRGIPSGLYRDNVMAAVQGEYRFPVYKIIKGAFFASTGDVFNSRHFDIDKIKVSYGAGIRFRLTRGAIRVNGRIDVTHTNYQKGLQYFITAMEAF